MVCVTMTTRSSFRRKPPTTWSSRYRAADLRHSYHVSGDLQVTASLCDSLSKHKVTLPSTCVEVAHNKTRFWLNLCSVICCLSSVPKVLDVGQCLVGGVKIAQFEIRNEGGSGRFALMKAEQWPASNFKVSKHPCYTPHLALHVSMFQLSSTRTFCNVAHNFASQACWVSGDSCKVPPCLALFLMRAVGDVNGRGDDPAVRDPAVGV